MMLDQFRFYLSHSINDLRTNKRLTFFALLSIATGVAAIVSLQTLAIIIGDTLQQNLQETNRGDVSAQLQAFDSIPDENPEFFYEESISFFGQTFDQYYLAEAGIDAIGEWIARSDFPDTEYTYRGTMTNFLSTFTGGGMGSVMSHVESGEQLTQLNAIVIDSAVYPYYGSVSTKDGLRLADALSTPYSVVVNDTVARDLDLAVGDQVSISDATQLFTVTGIVPTESEIKNPVTDIFTALFGFYMIDLRDVSAFEGYVLHTDQLYFKLADPTQVTAFDEAFRAEFSMFSDTTTVEDLRELNEAISTQVNNLMTIMGLVALLLGSIGIINTMQVVVRRRTLEIAVLKTIGMQAEQVTMLFLTEAFIMGVVGSIFGIVLGWVMTFVIKGSAETLFGTALPFRIALNPALSGLVVGTLVTTVFGFLPTLTAGLVRPGLVLRPTDAVLPPAGKIRTFLVLIFIILVISLIAQTILGNYLLAIGVVTGAFFAAGFMYVVLSILIWLIGRLFPSFGIIDLKISLRQMLAGRSRGASTLLALVVGVFSLSLITLMAESVNNLLRQSLLDTGGNVIISVPTYNQLNAITTILDETEGVTSYQASFGYQMSLVNFTDSETSTSYTSDELIALVETDEVDIIPMFMGGEPEEKTEVEVDFLTSLLLDGTLSAVDVTLEEQDDVSSGRAFTAEDATQPVLILPENEMFTTLGITVGDQLTYRVGGSGGGLAGLFGGATEEITFTVIGFAPIDAGINTDSGFKAPSGVFPERIQPSSVSLMADVVEENIVDLRRELSRVPGAFVIETSLFTRLFDALLGTFTIFPTLVAALGLVVGGVVIANSVALATMERRYEIAIMKAVGLQRERVLGMLLLENGILGFIGGLFGVGWGLLGLVGITSQGGSEMSAVVPFGTAFLLMMLCVVVALIAALTSAWSASGEKPLTVLRYE